MTFNCYFSIRCKRCAFQIPVGFYDIRLNIWVDFVFGNFKSLWVFMTYRRYYLTDEVEQNFKSLWVFMTLYDQLDLTGIVDGFQIPVGFYDIKRSPKSKSNTPTFQIPVGFYDIIFKSKNFFPFRRFQIPVGFYDIKEDKIGRRVDRNFKSLWVFMTSCLVLLSISSSKEFQIPVGFYDIKRKKRTTLKFENFKSLWVFMTFYKAMLDLNEDEEFQIPVGFYDITRSAISEPTVYLISNPCGFLWHPYRLQVLQCQPYFKSLWVFMTSNGEARTFMQAFYFKSLWVFMTLYQENPNVLF